ncbi:SOS-induced cell division inhibitor SulA [Enterobacteriaceae bacterium LUAb1]
MQIHSFVSQSLTTAMTGLTPSGTFSTNISSGLVSEIIYSVQQPCEVQMLLLPLLQQLNTQSRWHLWLSPPQKLSRCWFQQAGLTADKAMQLPQNAMAGNNMLDVMIKALRTGNYSVVLGWIEGKTHSLVCQRILDAAMAGRSLCLIMRPQSHQDRPERLANQRIMQSDVYH